MIETIHKGYIVKVFEANEARGITFKIIEQLPDGKFKNRRTTECNQYTGKRDCYGEKLYTPFESEEQAFERAINYIDNHIVPWMESKNNPKSPNYQS